MSYEAILVDRHERVGIITLNRPRVLNALNFQMVSELDQAISEMEDNEDIGAIVLTGSGERAFSAGGDIHENRELPQEELESHQDIRNGYQWHLATCTKPIIGAINGLCYGGATVMATSLDMLVGCERTSFRFLAVSYGQMNATWTLPITVGWPMAKELLYSGREMFAEEAYRIGLLNHVVSPEQLMDKALEIANTIAINHPQAVQAIKSLLIQHTGKSWEEMWQGEIDMKKSGFKGLPLDEAFSEFLTRKGRKPRHP